MAKSSPTYYIQITSLFQGDAWHTVLRGDDRKIAQAVADEMEVGEHEHGIGNPGLRGVRQARVMSMSELRKEGGWSAVERADDELGLTDHYYDETQLASRIWDRIVDEQSATAE